MAKIALVTLACDEHADLLQISGPCFQNYAKKWRMDFIPITRKIDLDRPAAWSKLLGVRKLLEKYDLVFYVDVDAVFLRFDLDVFDFVPENFDFAWAFSEVNFKLVPNAGVMLFRSTSKTKNLIDIAYNQIDLIFDGWWEQAALLRVLGHQDPREDVDSSQFRTKMIELIEVELDYVWNVTSHVLDMKEACIRHFAGDPLIIKKLLMLETLFQRYSFGELAEMGFDIEWLKREHHHLIKAYSASRRTLSGYLTMRVLNLYYKLSHKQPRYL